MEYELVYDAATSDGGIWSFVGGGVLFTFIGAFALLAIYIFKRYFGRETAGDLVVFFRFFFGFALVWTLVASFSMWHQTNETASASRNDKCLVAEGPVLGFTPMAEYGGSHESFSVQGVDFAYSDYSITGGYNNTVAHGGRITEGSQVRLCYFYRSRTQSNIIARVEIATRY